jgi:hypothetical protein
MTINYLGDQAKSQAKRVSNTANSAFIAANTADQKAVSAGVYANSAYAFANTIAGGSAASAYLHANSSYIHANAGFNQANTGTQYAQSAGVYANASYSLANTKFASAGGTISGDVIVSGNLTVSGATTTVTSEIVKIADNTIDLNSNFESGTPTENSGLRVIRGDELPVQFRWNEANDNWEYTNDGTNFRT